MPEALTPEIIASILAEQQAAFDLAMAAGGITRMDVVDGRELPPGYWFHAMTQCFLPPNFKFESGSLQ